jgi:hypothetical protein
MTGNSCLPPDYAAFFSARPSLSTWWSSNLASCGPNAAYPEEFWK